MAEHEIYWPAPPARWDSEGERPRVWAALLNVSPGALSRLVATLSPDEIERAERFRFEIDRHRFMAGRGFLRRILSYYVRTDASGIEFKYGSHGKPLLGGRFADIGLLFNLAHCENLALIAVTRKSMIGVDVERVQPLPDADDLAARYFSPRERARYRDLPLGDRPAAFFNIWTRKEAWLKATGDGIGCELNRVEVSPSCMDPRWQVRDLAPAAGFAAAVAIAADHPAPQCWRWKDDYD